MPPSSKRRYFHDRSQRRSHSSTNHDVEKDIKRRRLSDVSDGQLDGAQVERHGRSENSDDEGWQTVTSKRLRHAISATEQKFAPKDNDFGPSLRFYKNFKGDIQIKDLRNLALYVLSDGVAPNWLAVNNARQIKKVVVLMVPGLDQQFLEHGKTLLNENSSSGMHGETASSPTASATDDVEHPKPTSNDIPRTSNGTSSLSTSIAQQLVSKVEKSKHPHHHIKDWLFENVLNVRAPGDTRQSRVHSPLQAMLLTQDPEVKKDPNLSNGSSFKPTRISITELVHTSDELREAEYPIHRATFTSQADANLEMSRREQAGQSTANGWVDTNVSDSRPRSLRSGRQSNDSISQDLKVFALDCEMVLTSDEASSLARISLVQYPNAEVILDKYVKPALSITNYFTQYSGITPAHLENVTTTLHDIQQELLDLLDSSTILLGHSLESDLNALKLTHPFIIDTSMIYPHPRGMPLRSSLKFLANKYLRREIQTGGAQGHDSVEDARAVLDLVQLKCEKGLKWGTMEANGEPIFKRLSRTARTSAMVEYGTPERGLGKDATWTIGCQDDDEIVKGVSRSVNGDSFFDFDIPAQGADFVWARLRALEFARGWVSGPGAMSADNSNTNSESTTTIQQQQQQPEEGSKNELQDPTVLSTLNTTLQRIQEIYNALPTHTLLILFSGTADMRPVLKLQAMQQQYRREFKTKKWDELSVKWTDDEEQALKRACDDARHGWGAVVIK